MNYYDELIDNISSLIDAKEYDKAKVIVLNELDMLYIPSDIEIKLKEYLEIIKHFTFKPVSINDEDLINYLESDENHQLIAVDELSKRNLRDYIDLCNIFLKADKFIYAKCLLIDSLIKQEIDYEFEYINNSSLIIFNPKNMKTIEESDGFIEGVRIINDVYMKDASKTNIALKLLYKEAMLSLPSEINGKEKAKNIIEYIDSAFSAK